MVLPGAPAGGVSEPPDWAASGSVSVARMASVWMICVFMGGEFVSLSVCQLEWWELHFVEVGGDFEKRAIGVVDGFGGDVGDFPAGDFMTLCGWGGFCFLLGRCWLLWLVCFAWWLGSEDGEEGKEIFLAQDGWPLLAPFHASVFPWGGVAEEVEGWEVFGIAEPEGHHTPTRDVEGVFLTEVSV